MTPSLRFSSTVNAALRARYDLKADEDRKYGVHVSSDSERGILFVPLALEFLESFSQTLRKALMRMAVVAENSVFIT